MQATEINKCLLSKEEIKKDFIKLQKADNLKKNKNAKNSKVGVTEYPILDFDDRSLELLYEGVSETLKYSKVKPAGGKTYETADRKSVV